MTSRQHHCNILEGIMMKWNDHVTIFFFYPEHIKDMFSKKILLVSQKGDGHFIINKQCVCTN